MIQWRNDHGAYANHSIANVIILTVLAILKAMKAATETAFNTLRLRQNGQHLPKDIYKCIFLNENVRISSIFLNENVRISIDISLKFAPKCLINKILALVLIMAWHRLGNKQLSEPMRVRV